MSKANLWIYRRKIFFSRGSSLRCVHRVSRDSYEVRPWRDIDVMHNSSACKEAAWKIRRRKRHGDGGRRSDRSFVSGFPPSVYWLLTSIRKPVISNSTAEFVSQKSWERASNTNDDCCQMWVPRWRLAVTNAVCLSY